MWTSFLLHVCLEMGNFHLVLELKATIRCNLLPQPRQQIPETTATVALNAKSYKTENTGAT